MFSAGVPTDENERQARRKRRQHHRQQSERDIHVDYRAVPTSVAPHILIVEDDAVTRSIAGALLAKNGFRVSEAEDGVAALAMIDAERDLSLVVLDLAMPRMNGQEVLRQLRSSVATSTLPVVVLTGSVNEHMEVEMMDAGADDYVRKPLDPELFVSRIKATLRRSEH